MTKSMRWVLLFTTAIILLAGTSYGQTLQKGNLIGVHVATIKLEPGVTMEQFLDFYKSKVIPEYEKNQVGWKFYLVKSIRGEINNSFGFIIVIESENDRDKYFNADGSYNELGNSLMEKYKPISDELKKLGTMTTTYTDWVIQ